MEAQTAGHSGEGYEPPVFVEVGSVRALTQGHLFQPGQDNLSWIPVIGTLFGSN
jgi:hypothetical protein